eukprot:1735363-Amphidinium_carterae.1
MAHKTANGAAKMAVELLDETGKEPTKLTLLGDLHIQAVKFGDLVCIAGVQCTEYGGGLSLIAGESNYLTVEVRAEETADIIAAPAPVDLCTLKDVKPGSKADIAVRIMEVAGLQMKVVDSVGGSGTVRLSPQAALHGFSVGDTCCLHRVYVDRQRRLTLYEQGGVERMSTADFEAIRPV